MSEVTEIEDSENGLLLRLYSDPDYVSLYRFENPTIPYDENREKDAVSKSDLVGNWYTDSLHELEVFVRTRIRGQRGGRFVVVRVRKDTLDTYDATQLKETSTMDIERGNYVVPDTVSRSSRVEVPGVFKDEWEGRKNVPFADWGIIHDYINSHLSNTAILDLLQKSHATSIS